MSTPCSHTPRILALARAAPAPMDCDRFLHPPAPARGISSAFPAHSVALSQLLSGQNLSLGSCEAPGRPDNRYYHSFPARAPWTSTSPRCERSLATAGGRRSSSQCGGRVAGWRSEFEASRAGCLRISDRTHLTRFCKAAVPSLSVLFFAVQFLTCNSCTNCLYPIRDR